MQNRTVSSGNALSSPEVLSLFSTTQQGNSFFFLDKQNPVVGQRMRTSYPSLLNVSCYFAQQIYECY